MRETWDGVLTGGRPLRGGDAAGRASALHEDVRGRGGDVGRDLSDPAIGNAARARIVEIIEAYRGGQQQK